MIFNNNYCMYLSINKSTLHMQRDVYYILIALCMYNYVFLCLPVYGSGKIYMHVRIDGI